MPLHVFTCEKCGKNHDIHLSISDPQRPSEKTFECGPGCDGVLLYNFRATHQPVKARSGDIWTEYTSLGLGVLAEQKAEAEKELADAGVPTEFVVRDGVALPHFTSMNHRRRALKALGQVDKSAFM